MYSVKLSFNNIEVRHNVSILSISFAIYNQWVLYLNCLSVSYSI